MENRCELSGGRTLTVGAENPIRRVAKLIRRDAVLIQGVAELIRGDAKLIRRVGIATREHRYTAATIGELLIARNSGSSAALLRH
jgi:hypothetical protein